MAYNDISSFTQGAINGPNDPTQSVYKPRIKRMPNGPASIATPPNPVAAGQNAEPVTPTGAQGNGMPGAPGSMASLIPAVAASGPAPNVAAVTAPVNSFAARAASAGGVKQPDGSYAFSNMKGQSGYNANLDSLGDNTNVADANNMAHPGLGVATSNPSGGSFTPSVEQGASIASLPQNYGAPASYDPAQSASDYASDLASIASKDPRSVLGRAAWNASVDAASAADTARRDAVNGNGGRRTIASPPADTTGALFGAAGNIFNDQNKSGIAGLEALASNNNARLNYDSRLAAADSRANALMYGWGRRADATENAATTRANATTTAATTRANTPKVDAADTHGYWAAYNNAIGMRKSPEEARAIADGGRPQSQAPKQNQAPSQYDVQFLKENVKNNPALKARFDAHYGSGAADRVIGGQ